MLLQAIKMQQLAGHYEAVPEKFQLQPLKLLHYRKLNLSL
jgi:hypothetical protein